MCESLSGSYVTAVKLHTKSEMCVPNTISQHYKKGGTSKISKQELTAVRILVLTQPFLEYSNPY